MKPISEPFDIINWDKSEVKDIIAKTKKKIKMNGELLQRKYRLDGWFCNIRNNT